MDSVSKTPGSLCFQVWTTVVVQRDREYPKPGSPPPVPLKFSSPSVPPLPLSLSRPYKLKLHTNTSNTGWHIVIEGMGRFKLIWWTRNQESGFKLSVPCLSVSLTLSVCLWRSHFLSCVCLRTPDLNWGMLANSWNRLPVCFKQMTPWNWQNVPRKISGFTLEIWVAFLLKFGEDEMVGKHKGMEKANGVKTL